MQLKKSLKILNFHKVDTYFLIMLVLFLVFKSQWDWLVSYKLHNGVNTTLTSAELLVVAGLTITFYTLLQQVIARTLGNEKKYEIIEKLSSILILINILGVAISISLILVSSMGIDSLRMDGFYILIGSWVYNVTIMFFVLLSPLIEKALEKSRITLNLTLIIVLTFGILKMVFFPT